MSGFRIENRAPENGRVCGKLEVRVVTKRIPLRKCAGCGQMKPKKELIRVIRTADGAIEIDATGRKNGRGVYLCPDPECFRKAEKNKGLEHSLKASVPEEVYRQLEEEIKRIGQ